ncbi:helix-turn-helix domain-containing protein [Taibaiella koreensis]|uniref:helix-turn-helix domain-containing protein n=1 Tax=Taibaiella koreensis TaxID=1268548 RepID=UPI000E59A195|nr:AraC family transcriptional regulator [Taibaiella koreensis]
MQAVEIQYKKNLPGESIKDFVECFWMVENATGIEKEVVVMPDANFDLVISKDNDDPLQIYLLGIGTLYGKRTIEANSKMFFISFKLLALEYLFHQSIAGLLNGFQPLANDFWGFEEADLNDFDAISAKASRKIQALIPADIDNRKQILFGLIYKSNGEMTIAALSEQSFWSSRQINRYFTQYFGLSLKSYCSILRFKASFEQIKKGALFPELNFSDQAHFSREVKKRSGVNPRELHKNENDRFIQVSATGKK